MILFQHSCCLFAFILSATQAAQTLSSAQLQESSDISTNQVDLQGEGLSPNQFNLFPGSAEPETNSLLGSSQDSALLFDGDDGVTNVLPSLGIPVPDIFPNGFPKFIDPEGILRWLNKPEKPDCDNAFGCYLPVWRDNPDYRDTTYPGPLRLPKPRQPPKRYRKSRARPKPGEPDSNPPASDVLDPEDPNPSEPLEPGQKKRDWNPPESGEMGTTLLYAAKPHPKTRPIQQDPNDPRCSDAYLEGVGLHSFRNLRGPDDPEKPPVRKPTKTSPEQEQEQEPPPMASP
ncbi:hypothetical protein MMC31_000467, partial [Peltigera leucophlebia]|nr:hypothetical protein [Peltigera leucophlebia]